MEEEEDTEARTQGEEGEIASEVSVLRRAIIRIPEHIIQHVCVRKTPRCNTLTLVIFDAQAKEFL